ncbi:MAG: zinc ribbon domain-containing protein [Pseudomonadota bacterium]
MGYAIFFLIMAIVVAMIANSKGRYAFGWFLYGLLLWPIALVHALLLKPQAAQSGDFVENPDGPARCPTCGRIVHAQRDDCPYCGARLDGQTTGQPTPLPTLAPDERECPHCAELIKARAIKCKHCGSAVEPEVTA